MQEMSNTHAAISGFMITLIVAYLGFSIWNNITTRQQDDININNAKTCVELQTFYSNSMKFEYGFSDNKVQIDKVTHEEQLKAKELGCN